jgi:hypothetical protein
MGNCAVCSVGQYISIDTGECTSCNGNGTGNGTNNSSRLVTGSKRQDFVDSLELTAALAEFQVEGGEVLKELNFDVGVSGIKIDVANEESESGVASVVAAEAVTAAVAEQNDSLQKREEHIQILPEVALDEDLPPPDQ